MAIAHLALSFPVSLRSTFLPSPRIGRGRSRSAARGAVALPLPFPIDVSEKRRDARPLACPRNPFLLPYAWEKEGVGDG